MYPSQFLSLFPPFPREDKVFVAMSFDPHFDARWNKVILPGIRRVEVDGNRLEAYRVDTRRISDSIVTEILRGISNHRLIFADITTLSNIDGRPIRNGNVMYEVGLAHAARLAEEVILFRSDTDSLLFDLANVRVNQYDPDSKPQESQEQVVNAVVDALKELDLTRHLAVKRAVEGLDFAGWRVLLEGQDLINPPVVRTMRDALSHASRIAAIARLLDMGVLQTDFLNITPEYLRAANPEQPVEEMVRYRITPFGRAVQAMCVKKLGLTPELGRAIEEIEGRIESEGADQVNS
jgi:hypothetical protein